MSWKQTNDRNRPFTLGLNVEINVEELTTSGKLITNDTNVSNTYSDILLNKIKSTTFACDVSFTQSIHARDASFQRLESSSDEPLVFADDVSFGSSIQGNDVSFISIGSKDGNILIIADDVSFRHSIYARDASFHSLERNSEQALIFSNDVSFGGSIQCIDASLSSIGAIDGNELIINDDVSFNGHILVEDACFNVVEPTSGNLEFLSDVSFHGSIQANEAKFASIDSLVVNSEDIEFTLDIFPRKGGDLTGGQTNASAGKSTALSANGNVVAVGSTGYSSSKGRVQVFDYSGVDGWVQKGLDLTGGHNNAVAGYSTALSADGNVVAVGEPLFNNKAGRVRVFEYSSVNGWQIKGQQLLGSTQNGRNNGEGMSVALSEYGNVVAVGDTEYTNTNFYRAGRVRVFEYSSVNGWVQKGYDLSGGEVSALAGNSIALSANGNIVAVGERFSSYGNILRAGRVRVFEYINNNWKLRGQELGGTQLDEEAGYSTALSANGNVVAVGFPGYDYNNSGNEDEGRVQVFDYSGVDGWVQRGDDLSGGQHHAEAGVSTALSADGNVVAVGERFHNGYNVGRVRVFNYSSVDGWVQKNYDLSGQTNDYYEHSYTALSADGNIVAVGEPSFNNDEGRVSVYKYIDKANLSDIIDSIITG
jgi:hypothetical protein